MEKLAAVIGRRKIENGEPSFTVDQVMIKSADKLAFVVGTDKYVTGIEGSIPVLVKSGNWIDTAEEIDDLFLGDAEVWRRPSFGTAGPLGGDHPFFFDRSPRWRDSCGVSVQHPGSNPGGHPPADGFYPLVTKEGHHILDVIFTTPIPDLSKVAESLDKIAGVVDHGIVSSIQSYAVIASKGEVQVLDEKASVIP